MTATRPIFRFHLHIIQYSQRVQPVTTFLLKLNEQKKLELEEHKKCESIHFHRLNSTTMYWRFISQDEMQHLYGTGIAGHKLLGSL